MRAVTWTVYQYFFWYFQLFENETFTDKKSSLGPGWDVGDREEWAAPHPVVSAARPACGQRGGRAVGGAGGRPAGPAAEGGGRLRGDAARPLRRSPAAPRTREGHQRAGEGVNRRGRSHKKGTNGQAKVSTDEVGHTRRAPTGGRKCQQTR